MKKKLLSSSNPRSTNDKCCSPNKKTASRSTHHANGLSNSNLYLGSSNSNHKSNIANHLNNALT